MTPQCPTSLIWNYFDRETKDLSKCKGCRKQLLTKQSNTKGLWVHLRSLHPVDHSELNKLVQEEVKKVKECLVREVM